MSILKRTLTIWQLLTEGLLAATGYTGLASTVFGFAVLFAILIYILNLSRKGILQ